MLSENLVSFFKPRYACVLDALLCLTFCHLTDCSLPGSSVHGILQARILEWVAISSSKGSSWPRNRALDSCVPCICRQVPYQLSYQGSPFYLLILFFFFFITKIYFDKSALQPRSYLEFHVENWFHLNKRDKLTVTKVHLDFPGSPVDGNPPANAWDMVQSPVRQDPPCHGTTKPKDNVLRLHAATTEADMPRTCAPQEKPLQWEAHTSQHRVATTSCNYRKPSQSNEDSVKPKVNNK